MSRKTADAGAQKQRRQKLLLGVLGVLFVAVLAFELPSLRHSGGGDSAAATPATPAPSPARAAAPALVDTGAKAQPGDGQLASLWRFRVRDPFSGAPGQAGPETQDGAVPVAAVTESTPTPASPPAPPTTTEAAPALPTPAPTAEATTTPAAPPAPAPVTTAAAPERKPAPKAEAKPAAPAPAPAKPAAPARTIPPLTSLSHAEPAPGPPPAVAPAAVPGGALAPADQATIIVNGRSEDVKVGARFPQATPFFKLVKIEGGRAEVAPAEGTWADGSPTVTLVAGTTLTLTNTADGTQFDLRIATIG